MRYAREVLRTVASVSIVIAAAAAGLYMAGCGCETSGSPTFDGWSDGSCTPAECASYCASIGSGGGTCTAGICSCTGGDGTTDADLTGLTTTVTGKVWSPGHIVPISGALVYFATAEPSPIPSGAYPETCVDPPSSFFVRTAPDGTFQLEVLPGPYYMVVQKGQFRRVRSVTVPEDGPMAMEEILTTFPSENGPGDTIPHMALVFALDGGDHIEDVLAKLTLGGIGGDNRLIQGTENFDIYNISGYPPLSTLMENYSLMSSYHIIFFPCTIADSFVQLEDPTAPLENSAVLDNLRAFANAGGKIYATDMMYDVFEQPMPVYLDMCGDDATINDADETAWADTETAGGWTSNGYSIDPDLSAWLDAIGVGHLDLQFHENFVWIEEVYDIPDPLPGEPVPPKIWVQGDFVLDPSRTLPLTVTFPYGAGKVLFSTYHTVGDGATPGHAGIYPQEYVLLYLIMEIGVCQSPII